MHEPLAELVPLLGRALLHFLWQGVLIGLLAALALQLLRDARPQARYAAACLALLACVLAPLATLLLELAGGTGHPAAPSAAPAFSAATTVAASAPRAWASGAPLLATLPVQGLLPWIVAGWAAGACALSLRLAAGVWWLGRLPGVHAPQLQRRWQRRLDALAQASGMNRGVVLRLVDALDTPAAAGWWRPVVLLPVSLLARMPADYIEALLAHELAHVRRHDYLVNLLQGLAEALLFYHPVTWWLSRRIHAERELVADRLAADATGEPRRLAQALAGLADHQAAVRATKRATPQPALAALAPHGGHLMSRIEHLVRPGRSGNRGGRLVFPLLGLAAAGLAFYAHAQRQPHVVASIASTSATPAAQETITAAPASRAVATPKATAAPAPTATPQPVRQAAPAAPAAASRPAAVAPAATRGASSSWPAPPAPPAPPPVPAAPAPAAPPAPPAPPASLAPPAPPAAPAPPPEPSLARASGASGDDAYALVRKGSETYMISGSGDDQAQIEAARRAVDGDFIWFRRDGKAYVVTDPAAVASMRKSWAEADALGDRMQALGQEMEGHGRRMEAIGREMERVAGAAAPPAGIEAAAKRIEALSRQQGELAARQAQLSLAMVDADDARRDALERQMQGLERDSEALSAKIDAQSQQIDEEARRHEQSLKPIDALARKMNEASRPMEALSQQMDGLGRQMDQVSRRAEGETRRLIAEALDKGLARPLPQRQ